MAGTLGRRVALVTGAASGIGQSSALAFAQHGARVVVADVLEVQGRSAVALLSKGHGGSDAFRLKSGPFPDIRG
jgi:NAD(P)-dependent dehydrogenase (short-subunit alcohol dehydrogenase family)